MIRSHPCLLFFLVVLPFVMNSQESVLPPDFRQHNLTEYNSSLLSPIFSLDRNNPRSIALWSRWQWQSIDGDPSTLFFNYTERLSTESSAGAGFFQHNTGTFVQTGGILNYAFALALKSNAQIAFGLNLLGYRQELADELFQPDPNIPLPQLEEEGVFILQLAPSLRFKLDKFNIGLVAENQFDYNFDTKEKATRPTEKVYSGWASYEFPIVLFGAMDSSFLRPSLYMKTIPQLDNQYGINTLLSSSRFWTQVGYNNFYGFSTGIGGRFFRNLSVGALLEFGSDNNIDGSDTSFEFITAYNFGSVDIRKRVIGFEEEEDTEVLVDAPLPVETPAEEIVEKEPKESRADRRRREKDSIASASEAISLAEIRRIQQQRALDSIGAVKREEALAASRQIREEARRDSIARSEVAEAETLRKANLEAEVAPVPGEKFEETRAEGNLEPGFYLVANVFGTKKYFEGFMKTLSEKGIQPKSFYREQNKYNYVYLERYDSVEEARKARDSKFDGRYLEDTWIFRVVGR